MKKIILIILIVCTAGGAWGQAPGTDRFEPQAKRVSFVGTLGLNLGGDELPTDEDANEREENDMKAGDGLSFKLGVIVQPFVQYPDWEIQTTIGWKEVGEFNTDDDDDGDFSTFSRYPLDLMAFYKINKLRCGAGLTYHINPKLEGDKLPSDVDGDFDNALGFVMGVDYLIGNHFLVGANYEIIDYESDTEEANGNNMGVSIGFRF
jgi:hypothetical protein